MKRLFYLMYAGFVAFALTLALVPVSILASDAPTATEVSEVASTGHIETVAFETKLFEHAYTFVRPGDTLLDGDFTVSGSTGPVMLVVSPDGRIEFYCTVDKEARQRLSGEVTRLSGSTLSHLQETCIRPAEWKVGRSPG